MSPAWWRKWISRESAGFKKRRAVNRGPLFSNLSLTVLEDRVLLASSLSASLTAGILTIEGTDGSDQIVVRRINDQISVDGIAILANGIQDSSVSANQVSQIHVSPLTGNDTIDLSSGVISGQQPILLPIVIDGGEGNKIFRYDDGVGGTIAVGPDSSVKSAVVVPTSTGQVAFTLHVGGSLAVSSGISVAGGGVTQLLLSTTVAGRPAVDYVQGATLYQYDGSQQVSVAQVTAVAQGANAQGQPQGYYTTASGALYPDYYSSDGIHYYIGGGVTQLLSSITPTGQAVIDYVKGGTLYQSGLAYLGVPSRTIANIAQAAQGSDAQGRPLVYYTDAVGALYPDYYSNDGIHYYIGGGVTQLLSSTTPNGQAVIDYVHGGTLYQSGLAYLGVPSRTIAEI